MREKDKETIW